MDTSAEATGKERDSISLDLDGFDISGTFQVSFVNN